MVRYLYPQARPRAVVGLLGGSFNPPHAGHLNISLAALQRFALDEIWWMLSPGNPLKSLAPQSLSRRIDAARALHQHSKIVVTDIEQVLRTRYTSQTLAKLCQLFPDTYFIWLMGADNLVQIDKWHAWQKIFHTVPIGVLARPGHRMAARRAKAARLFQGAKLPQSHSRLLGHAAAPAWCFVNLPMHDISSTKLRQAGNWPS